MIKYSHLSVRTYENNVVTIFMILVLLLSFERRHYDTHLFFFSSYWSIKRFYLWFLILCSYELCGCVCSLCSLFSPFYFNFCFVFLLHAIFVVAPKKWERKCGVDWVQIWKGFWTSGRRKNHDENILYKKIAIKTKDRTAVLVADFTCYVRNECQICHLIRS